MAAGPGNANENVGFDAEGTPPALRGPGGAGGPAVAGWLVVVVVLLPPPPEPDFPVEPEPDPDFGVWLWGVGFVWVV
jgi:hypothetical protein